ncbi:MAG: helix-turn-helix domain-containing protein [Bacteroides sp.]|nr:helix-turn-helix domain-containing protein [Eubacterium sp.]MCM1417438.1 helix-turn-helix domain-containing protein [Roseburia sp.]MCM1461618.1 helix-turn-helix domain-containing protein [Bacteroides sp.]
MDRLELEYRLNLSKSYRSPHPPYNEEHAFYDLVAAGDTEGILNLRDQYAAEPEETEKGVLSDDPIRNAIYHFVVNCTIMTRRCIVAGMPQEEAYTLSDLLIRRADQCTSVREVRAINDEMALEFASRMKQIINHPVSPRVREVIEYVNNNIYTKLSTLEIAKRIGYDRRTLSRQFREEMGCPINEYIHQKRIEVAKSLIEGGTPLVEISHMLCYSTQSHFCKCFHDRTGITPGEYQRRIKLSRQD